MRLLALILILIVFSSSTPISKDSWIDDVQYFSDQLVKRHKNAFHHISKAEFDSDVNKLIEDIPKLEDYQIIVSLQQITAKIGDGHTAVHIPTSFKSYPIVMSWFGDELYIVAATEQYKTALGGRIVKVGDMGIDEVYRRLKTTISENENKWLEMNVSAAFIRRPEFLITLGIVAEYDHAVFTFIKDNEEIRMDIPAMDPDPKRVFISASKEQPLYRQQRTNNFWFSYVENINAVFLSWKNYEDLNKNSDDLFDFIRQKKATRLIVDMRFNGGGDFKKGRRLIISRIQADPKINQKGNLFVITGRATFSAAMVNSIDFKKLTNAIILGEPPGERPNSYSENDEMTLPNSKLVISYSTEYYKFLDEDVDSFEPDVRIDPAWRDFVEGRDAVMEWITEKVKSEK